MCYAQLLFAALLACGACHMQKRSPLADLGAVTSARVVAQRTNGYTRVVQDTALLNSIVRLGSRDGSWKEPWDTPPSGQLRAVLYRDTVYLGVVAISPTFVGARGRGGEAFRTLTPSERQQAVKLLSQLKL